MQLVCRQVLLYLFSCLEGVTNIKRIATIIGLDVITSRVWFVSSNHIFTTTEFMTEVYKHRHLAVSKQKYYQHMKTEFKRFLIPHFLLYEYFLNKGAGAGHLWSKETDWRSLWKFGDKSGKHRFTQNFKMDRFNKGNQVLLLLLLWKRSERIELATCETRFHSHIIQKWACFVYSTHRYLLHPVRFHLIWVEPFCKNILYMWRL
jgi:hypothetical protein